MEPVSLSTEDDSGSILDRLIGYLSPKWALERAQARALGEQLASYRGAYRSRLGRPEAVNGRADYHLEATQDRWDAINRARQLERSSVIAEGLLSRAVENVVGCGFKLQVQSKNDTWNKEVEERWKDWAEFDADVRGMSPLDELLALTYRSWLRDGDVGTILLSDGKLQHVESDQIASPMGNVPTKDMIDGIKLDKRGKPLSYFVVTEPDPILASVRHGNPHTEIDAKDMLFLARRQRLGQTRGMSALVTVAWLLDQIDGQIEAVTVASRMAACLGLVIQRNGRMGGLSTTTDGDGNTRRKLRLEPGSIMELEPGDSVTQINPAQPSTSIPDFMAMLGRLVGLAFGLPLEVAFLDFSRTNYSSARAALLQAHQVWRGHQDMLKRYMSRIFRWWIIREIESGRITSRRDALSHSWIAPGWKWVDPEKELTAALGAVDAGIMTLGDVAMQQGRDFEELVTARKREREMIRKAGLPDVRSTLTREPAVPVQPLQPTQPQQPEDPA